MILTIDVGNSNIVLGVWQDGKLVFVSRLETKMYKTSDEFAVDLHNILGLYGISEAGIDGAVVSSVVAQITGALSAAIYKLTGKKPLIVGPGIKTGLNIMIENPAILGSDMVADAVGAIALYELPAVVIDMGTAIKIFAVNQSGSFLGCAIMPGVLIGLKALSEYTATLPRIGLDAPREVIGRNSEDSMKSGAVYGTASMVDGMVERFEKIIGKAATIVATGGYAGDIVPHCMSGVIFNPGLTMEGLYHIYLKNRPTV